MRSVSHSSSETRHEACTPSWPPGALHGVQYRVSDYDPLGDYLTNENLTCKSLPHDSALRVWHV